MKKYIILLLILFLCGCAKKVDRVTYELSTNYYNDISSVNMYIGNESYTFDNPKVVNNPSNNSSLTSLIIFSTSYETSIELYINDVFVTVMEKSFNHSIPIYGLKEKYDNKIFLKDDLGNTKELIISTEGIDMFSINYSSSYSKNRPLFLVSSSGKYALDNDGDVVWKNSNTSMDIAFVSSDKYLIVDDYDRVVLTDLMGQVYKVYGSYAHSSNHKIKVYDDYFIYTDCNYDLVCYDYDGKLLWKVNINDIITDIDKSFLNNSTSNKINFSNYYHMNEYHYFEDTNTLLISIRSFSAIIYYDLSNKKLLWLFSDNDAFGSEFDDYKINLVSGNYFHGQHSPILKDNLLYVFDNNFLSNIKDEAGLVIYSLSGMDAYQIYSYSDISESLYGGSIYLEDDLIEINYGSGMDSFGKHLITEISNNEVITTVKFSRSLSDYSSFRHSLYDTYTDNYEISDIVIFDSSYKISSIKLNTKGAFVDENLLKYDYKSIRVNTSSDYVVYFKSKNGIYCYDSSKDSISLDGYLSLLNGSFDIYVYLYDDDTLYDTNVSLNID